MKRAMLFFALMLCLPSSRSMADSAPSPSEYLLYVGTFTRGQSKGIYAFRFDVSTGKLHGLGLAAQAVNPSFVVTHPNGRFLYSVMNKADGQVSAYAVNRATGILTLLNRVASRGDGPCYVSITRSGDDVLVANYTSGSAAVLPVKADGTLGEATAFAQHSGASVNPERQTSAHTHSFNPSPDGRFAIAADLGVDKLYVYRLDRDRLVASEPPFVPIVPGSGPRHFAFHPSLHYAYLLNELKSSVVAFRYDPRSGELHQTHVISALPQDYAGTNLAADIHVHPSGKFLYASDRGFDSIGAFSIDTSSGRLALIGFASTRGKTPRNFAIDPTGSFLLAGNEDSNTIVVFRIDPQSGRLALTGEQASVPNPACLAFIRH